MSLTRTCVAACLVMSLLELTCADEATDKKSVSAIEDRELHLISVYQGRTRTDGKIHGGKATVKVDRPGKTVTLVLSSYESITWSITATPETKLAKVILGGYHRQAAAGLDDKVVLVNAFHEGGQSQQRLYHAYDVQSSTFRRLVREVNGLTGLEISSFQGLNSAQEPFLIDRVLDDPRIKLDYPRPTPKADLPKLEFTALHLTPGAHPHSQQASYGEFTLQGPKEETLKPVGEIRSLAIDPDTKTYYGLTMHELVTLDMGKRKTEKVEESLDVPRLSWPRCLTFDAKRKRLIVVGDNLLYAFTPAEKKWVVLTEIERPLGYAGIGYDAASDMFYALATSFGGEGREMPVIHKINAEGAIVDRIKLSAPFLPGIVDGGRANPPSQIVPVDGKLVIIAGGGRDSNSGMFNQERFIYLVDPKAEKVWLTAKDIKAGRDRGEE